MVNSIKNSIIGRSLNFFALLSFLLLQVPSTAFAASGTKVTHDAIKYFVPEKRIRLEATVVDPKSVMMVRAYFKGKTQADYVFVPMEQQQTVPNSYVATLPALAKSNETLEYLFLAVNGANEVVKTEPFVVKAKDSKDVPSWQMVKDDEPMKLFTEVPNAPSVAATFSDSVSLNVAESGARFGLVVQLYSTPGSASALGAPAGATNGGTASVATTGISTTTIAVAAAAVAGVGAAAGGGGGSGGASAAPAAAGGGTTATSNGVSPFAGTWTETMGTVTCTGINGINPGGVSGGSGKLVISSTGTIPQPTSPTSGPTISQYSGSISTSGALRITFSADPGNGLSIIDYVETGTLTKTGAATGTGHGNITGTYRPPISVSCTWPITYSLP